jgi:RHS repeat-associated protein
LPALENGRSFRWKFADSVSGGFMRKVLGVAVLAFFALVPSSRAQITNVTNDQSTPIPGAGHDYIKMLTETVNPSNGSVSLRIQAPAPKGRLLTIPFGFDHDTNGVHHLTTDSNGTPIWAVDSTPYSRGGWSYLIPLVTYVLGTQVVSNGLGGESSSCNYYSGFVYKDPSGASHALGIAAAQPYTSGTCLFPLGGIPNAGDDYYRASTPSAWGTPAATVVSADGTVYNFVCTPCSPNNNGDAMATVRIEDRNGNTATSTSNNSSGAYTLTDTLKRPLISTSSFASSSGDKVYLSGLTNPYVATWKTETSDFTIPIDHLDGACPVPTNTDERTVVSSITLPNGQAYTFLYGTDDPNNSNPYGLLSKIAYPSGGWVKYGYGINAESDAFDTTVSGSGGQSQCLFLYGTPAVTQRTVSFDGSHVALQQTFAYSTSWNMVSGTWTTKTSTVTTDDMVSGLTFVTNYAYSYVNVPDPPYMVGGGGSQVPVESTITYEDGSGNVLQTVTKTWQDQYLLTQQETTPTGVSSGSIVDYSYGSGGQVTKKTEYAYGQSSPTRVTTLTYETFPNTPIYTEGPSIFDRPCQIVTSDGSNNRVAETDYLYDGGTTLCGTPGTSSTTSASTPSGTHDETNYGTGSSVPRGNATTVTKQCFPSCANAVSVYTYDETGQVHTFEDPNLNTTTYSYLDSYTTGGAPPSNTDAYLTQIKRPTTSNGYSHISNYSYSYSSGQLTVAEDENSQFTYYTYADPLARLTNTTYPDGGQTSISYNDAAPSPTITTSKLITSGLSLTGVVVADGVGHPVEKEVTSDPQGTDYTAITYDGSGNIHTQSNPYRSTSDTTYGNTTTLYDALNRPKLVTKPDGSKVTTSYSGNTTTVTDEAGKTRESFTDGLGRMTEVIEGPGVTGFGYVTNYTYDSLDDLKTVVQGGSRNRNFIYDSLKRLTSSQNPETGTTPVLYTYDTNGNVLTKKDARGITITYTWDALNRMNERTYSNGDHYVGYGYDSATCVVVTTCYNIGRMTSMTDAPGSESWAYDRMGRLWGDERSNSPNPGAHVGSIVKYTSYTYNLDGSLATLNYPSGHSVAYTMSGAGLPLTAADSALTSYAYASSGEYTAWGARNWTTYGGYIGENILYNDRLQPCWTFVNTVSGLSAASCTGSETAPAGLMDVQYNFNVGADNGNLGGITNNRNTNRSQTYVYDAVNRITSAATLPTCTANCWNLAFTLDEWANLTAVTGTGNATLTTNANNQISVAPFTYDASGNELTDVTSTYTWNAESEMKTGGGVTNFYDGRGNRVEKLGSKMYWYGPSGEVLDETDATGSTANAAFSEYVYFAGARIARRDYLNNVYYYFEDQVNSSRVIAEMPAGSTTPTLCYDADFYPYGGEIDFTDTCAQNYKFQGKERDPETGNDYFGARFYSSTYGRFLSPDWSSVPAPVPYANLTNPQTLNLFAFVNDNPESFADLTGHDPGSCHAVTNSTTSEGQPAGCSTGTPSKNDSNQNKKQVANGVGQIGVGVAVGVGVALAPESAGVSVVVAGVLVGGGLVVKGSADVMVGATGGGDTSEMKDGMDMAQNPVAMTVYLVNGGNVKQANDVGSVVGGVSAVKDLAERPTSAVGFLMAAKDAFEGARAAVSLTMGAVANFTMPHSVRALLPTNY